MHISAVWGVVVERVSVCWLRRRRESTTHRVPGPFGLVESWVGCCINVFVPSFLPSEQRVEGGMIGVAFCMEGIHWMSMRRGGAQFKARGEVAECSCPGCRFAVAESSVTG